MSNARPPDPLGYTATHEWRPGFLKPEWAGRFERKHALGISVDYFDGGSWRRPGKRAVLCANQDLPWRAVP